MKTISNNLLDGELYSWGLNNYGQLGLGQISSKINKPNHISSVAGVPIAFIACGGYHSFCITKYVSRSESRINSID